MDLHAGRRPHARASGRPWCLYALQVFMSKQRGIGFTRRAFGTGLLMLGASAIGLRAQAQEPAKPARVPTPRKRPGTDETKAVVPAKADKAWLTLPPTPKLPEPTKSAVVTV